MPGDEATGLVAMTWPKVAAICLTVAASAAGATFVIGNNWLGSMDRNSGRLQQEFARVMSEDVQLQKALGTSRVDLVRDISQRAITVSKNSATLDAVKESVDHTESRVDALYDALLKAPPRK